MPEILFFPYYGPNRHSEKRVVEFRLDFGGEPIAAYPLQVSDIHQLLLDAGVLHAGEPYPPHPLMDDRIGWYSSLLVQTALLFQSKSGHRVGFTAVLPDPLKRRCVALMEHEHSEVGMAAAKLAVELLAGVDDLVTTGRPGALRALLANGGVARAFDADGPTASRTGKTRGPVRVAIAGRNGRFVHGKPHYRPQGTVHAFPTENGSYDPPMHFDLTTLPTGLRVITEPVAGVRSVALGCWVDTGTRDEADSEAGASHFLEHLLFKGSEHLSAREISERFDAMGAQSNAFTSKDYTCYWARLLDDDLEEGFELLAEMLQRPAFRSEEIDSERQVVIEEINMNDDDPGDLAHEEFFQAVFAGHPLERPVLGTRRSVTAMTRDDLAGYWKRRYQAGSTVLAVAGSVDHAEVVELTSRYFGTWNGDEVDHELAALHPRAHVRVVNRSTEQAHLVIGGNGLLRGDDRRFAFEVLNHVLGGGLSSRLFRVIREERGLAYAVYSFRAPYADAGAWGVYAGTTPSQAISVLELIREEINGLIAGGVTVDELDRAKGNMRGGLALALEDPNSRMIRLGRDELTRMEHLSVDEKIRRIEAVTASEVQEVAETVLSGTKVMGAVGPFDGVEFEEFLT